jgi:hypothetical protein
LASHFEILDYVRITPAWGLPAVVVFGFIGVFSSIVAFFSKPDVGETWRSPEGPLRFAYFIAIIQIGLFGFLTFFSLVASRILHNRSLSGWAAIFGAVLLSESIAFVIGLALVKASYDRPLFQDILGYRYAVVGAGWLNLLLIAFFFGLLVASTNLRHRSMTRVVLAEEIPDLEGAIGPSGHQANFTLTPKEKEVEGKLIFRLSHSVLLLTNRHGSPLVVIPEEKIERIESMKNHYPL